MNRRPLVCANWKLNHLRSDTEAYLKAVSESKVAGEVDVVVAPVATLLYTACEVTKSKPIHIAAQNVFHEKSGAFTGEWSVEHLKELGCTFAIVGHSERRQYFNESDESTAKKVKACFEGGITPIACVGETLAQRKDGEVSAVLNRQVSAILEKLSSHEAEKLVIAYEPVWAIGTGKTASASDAENAHLVIRACLEQKFGFATAQKARILYGGSLKAENAEELASQPNIDGALVGGASLSAPTFLAICASVAKGRKHLQA